MVGTLLKPVSLTQGLMVLPSFPGFGDFMALSQESKFFLLPRAPIPLYEDFAALEIISTKMHVFIKLKGLIRCGG